jgi:hypothetical protein
MARLMEEATVSFLSGQNDAAPATSYRPDEAATLLNYRITPEGEAEVRGGSKRTHATALNSGAQGWGGIAFQPSSGTAQWVVFVGDSAYYSTDEGANWTLIASALRQDYWDFATMTHGGTSYLYCANGSTTLYRWDGATWSTVTGPTTGCTRLEVHNERLWTTNGVNVYASKAGDPSVWAAPDGVVVPFNTHDGDDRVTALYAVGPWLLVFKRKSFGYVEGYGNADVISNAGSRGLSRDVGCIAFRSLVAIGGGGLMWMSRRGFEFYVPGGQPTLVSRSVETFLRDINWSDIEANEGIPTAYFYPAKLTYECELPGVTTQNDQTFVYRIPSPDRPGAASIFDSASASGDTVSVVDGFLTLGGGDRLATRAGFLVVVTGSTPGVYADVSSGFLALATNDATSAATFTADRGSEAQAPVSVGYDGFVRALDTGSLDDLASDGTGGNAINDRLVSRPFVFGDPFRKKRGRTVRVIATADGPVTPSVRVVADGADGTAHTVSIPADTLTARRVRVNGRGKELQVKVTSAGAGTRISGVAVGAEPLLVRP